MNSIEDRLRAATQAAARTVADGSAAPLRLPQRRSRARLPRRRVAAVRLLAPVAAAAAVAAAVATTVAVGELITAGHQGVGPSAVRTVDAAPRYFVALVHPGPYHPGQIRTTDAVIASTATGRIITRVAVPAPCNAFVAVSGAADDRTFVLAAQHLPVLSRSLPDPVASPATRWYQLRINPAGQPRAVLTALPLPVLPAGSFTISDSIALSPDGSRLAVQLSGPHSRPVSGVRVYDLAGGGYWTWSLPSRDASASPPISSPSWDAGSRYLALLVYSTSPHACAGGCVRLLDTATSGGNVIAASSIVFPAANVHRLVSWNTALITPDGSQLLLAGMAGTVQDNGVAVFSVPVIYRIATRSGQILSHLAGHRGNEVFPLWASANARFLILARPNPDAIISITAAIYGPRNTAPVRLPAHTLQAAW